MENLKIPVLHEKKRLIKRMLMLLFFFHRAQKSGHEFELLSRRISTTFYVHFKQMRVTRRRRHTYTKTGKANLMHSKALTITAESKLHVQEDDTFKK